MRRKPIEYNNEFITETVVQLYSETRITVGFDTIKTSTILVTLGVRTKKPGDGTPLYGLYRYVRPQRVGIFSRFGHK